MTSAAKSRRAGIDQGALLRTIAAPDTAQVVGRLTSPVRRIGSTDLCGHATSVETEETGRAPVTSGTHAVGMFVGTDRLRGATRVCLSCIMPGAGESESLSW